MMLALAAIAGAAEEAAQEDRAAEYISELEYEDLVSVVVTGPQVSLRLGGVEYEPNTDLTWGFSYQYKNLATAFSLDTPSSRDTSTYGDTTYFDVQSSYYERHYGIDMMYHYYDGFYLENEGSVDKRSDIAMRGWGANFFYVFSDVFSFRAAFNFTERQRRSAFAFLLMSSVSDFRVSANDSLLPASAVAKYPSLDGLEDMQMRTISLSPGIAYTHLLKGTTSFLTVAWFQGWGQQSLDYSLADGNHHDTGVMSKSNLRFSFAQVEGFGYLGVSAFMDVTEARIEKESVLYQVMGIRLFVGLEL